METRLKTKETMRLTVIGAEQAQFEHCCLSLPEMDWAAVPVEQGTIEFDGLPDHPDVIVVYAGKTQTETLNVCKQLRMTSCTANLPILLVVNRYDITHAFVAKQTRNTDLLVTPFDGAELEESIAELLRKQPETPVKQTKRKKQVKRR